MMRDSGFGAGLQADYERHPSFGSAQAPLEIDPRWLEKFANGYALARRCATRLSAADWAACRSDLLAALDHIFAQLGRQSADSNEQRFIEELHSQSRRLLQEELQLFGRKPTVRGLSFATEEARSGAARMAHCRHFFGRLSVEAVAEILTVGAADLDNFRARVAAGRVTRDDLSVNGGPTVTAIVRVLNREFGRQGVLNAVSAYMGIPMKVAGAALELSVPRASWWANSHSGLARGPRTLYAHLDESILYPKSIAYLTDVAPANGPTSVYPGAYECLALEPLQALIGRVIAHVGSGTDSPLNTYYAKQYHQSMSSEPFRRHFMRLPRRLRFNSHFGWDVLPDSPAERMLAECESVMTGPAGTYVVFDGARLLHRGGLMESGERIALQIIFADVSWRPRIANKLRGIAARVRKPA